ncbi:MAG TPA: protein kinase [Gemmatimonadales bacterium]|jgi:tRNA A-37 threonylcarbamoyl transferase component Bud32/tetratricopeptide (TPR) repeat protein|nr:protein kinase [Gemmatimonadales bacterium]
MSSVTADLRDQLQQTLGTSYTLEQELGGGGMSRVFTATETRLHRRVVIKVLSPELAAGVSAERFDREIQLAASLQQANIVPLLSAGDTNGLPYFTMPYVEGESLRSRLGQGPLSITEAVGILRDVARALSYAHERGIVHRDIKPDNVLLSHGTAVVTDFGIAKALSASRTESGAALTQTGTVIGTPAYMAPEQVAGDAGADHRVDLYAFGCTAYELLAGHPPFHGRTPARTLAAQVSEPAPKVSDARPDTPPVLADLVTRCLAKDPDQRPRTAADLVPALDTVSTGSSLPAMTQFPPGSAVRRALAWYAGAVVAVALLARLATSVIGLPEWVFPGALIAMALGLPVILLTVLKAGPHLSRRRAMRGAGFAFGGFVLVVAGFMVLRELGLGPAGSLLAAGRIHQRDQLILTDFRVSSADSALGRVASDAVRQGLLESSVLSLLPPAAVAAAIERTQRPATTRLDLRLAQDIALRQGIKAIIDGEVTGVAGGYVVTLRLVSADSLNPIASVTATGSGPQGFINAMDKVTRALRSRAGESLRKVQRTVPLADATTGSLAALRKYSEAFRANGIEQNAAKAVGLATEAVRLDSTFAMGWRLLGTARINAGMGQAAGDSALERAYQLRGRLSERERRFVEATYLVRGPHRSRPAAIAAWEGLLAIGNAIDSGAALNYLGIQLSSRREFARAESLYVLAIRTDSSQAFPYTNRVPNLVTAGRLADARAAADLAVRHDPGLPAPRRLARELLYHEGRLGELRREVDSLSRAGVPDAQNWALGWKRVFALRDGRLAEWERLTAPPRAEDLTQALPAAGVAALVRRNRESGATRLEAALNRSPLKAQPIANRPYLTVAEVLAALGRAEQARALLGEYGREVSDTARRRLDEPARHSAMGEVLLAEHRYPDALAEFRRGDTAPDGPANGCVICLPWQLGRVFEAAGQTDSAIVMYERVLSLPQWGRQAFDASVLPYVHERLGALHESKGDAVKAAGHYRALMDLWKNADSELQPRVEAARAAVRRLADVEPRSR